MATVASTSRASFVDLPARKESFSLFIDKTTGQFLCKDTLVGGSWEDLQDCLEVMQKEGQDCLSPHVLLGYPESVEEQEERERELREVQTIWSSSVPLTDLHEDEAHLIKTMFQVLLAVGRPPLSVSWPWTFA
ncbi:twinkle protein, mitochondrial-like [Xiphias gladius]|uniref:twinkle protein, mitochondrial-like n=1 Tax=Xiphias gladius TaxID=8245 RepID=UPI001A984188|nr:twinkle protein, mitochondrial-like [Xiphias gladius]